MVFVSVLLFVHIITKNESGSLSEFCMMILGQ